MRRFFFFLVFSLVCVCLLPFCLSTSWGSRAVESMISYATHTVVSSQNLSLSWTGPQRVEHLSVKQGPLQMYIESCELQCSFFDLVRHSLTSSWDTPEQILERIEAFQPQLDQANIHLIEPNQRVASLKNVSAHTTQTKIKVSAVPEYEENTGSLKASYFFDAKTGSVDTEFFPTALIEFFAQAPLEPYLGPYVSGSVTLDSFVDFSFHTPFSQGQARIALAPLTLLTPLSLQGRFPTARISPEFSTPFLIPQTPYLSFKLEASLEEDVIVSNLFLEPFACTFFDQPLTCQHIHLHATLDPSKEYLSYQTHADFLAPTPFAVHVEGDLSLETPQKFVMPDKCALIDFPTPLIGFLDPRASFVQELLGPSFSIQAIHSPEKLWIEASSSDMDLSTFSFQTSQDTWILTEPTSIHIASNPTLLDIQFQALTLDLKAPQHSTWELSMQGFNLDYSFLPNLSFPSLHAHTKLAQQQLHADITTQLRATEMIETAEPLDLFVNLSHSLDTKTSHLTANLAPFTAQIPQITHPISCIPQHLEAHITPQHTQILLKTDIEQSAHPGHISCQAQCTASQTVLELQAQDIANPFLPDVHAFLMGDVQHVQLLATLADTQSTGTLELASKNLQIQTQFLLDPQTLHLQPLKAYHPTLTASHPPLQAELFVEQLLIPITAITDIPYTLSHTKGAGSVQLAPISLKHHTLAKTKFSFQLPPGSPQALFELHTSPQSEQQLQAQLQCSTQQTPFDTINLYLHGTSLPLKDLSELLDTSLTPFLDNDAQITLHANTFAQTGPLEIHIQSPTLSLESHHNIYPTYLECTQPAHISYHLTPERSLLLFGESVPLLSTLSTQAQLTLAPENSYIPFSQTLENLHLETSTLTLTHTQLYPSLELHTALNLLNSSITPPLTLEATPIYFSSNHGKILLKRFDFLLHEHLDFALWGSIDFNQQFTNLRLGIGPQTLTRAFHLKNIPSNFFLPIQIKGPFGKTHINEPKAAAKISALIATARGTPETMLVGTLLQLVSDGIKTEKIPPPTTKPPWQNNTKTYSPIKSILKTLIP